MPADIFAALGALVRAEAARNPAPPGPHSSTPVQPQNDGPAPQTSTVASVPRQSAPPSSTPSATATPAPPPVRTATSPSPGRVERRLRRWSLRAWRVLWTLVRAAGRRRGRAGSTEGEPVPDA